MGLSALKCESVSGWGNRRPITIVRDQVGLVPPVARARNRSTGAGQSLDGHVIRDLARGGRAGGALRVGAGHRTMPEFGCGVDTVDGDGVLERPRARLRMRAMRRCNRSARIGSLCYKTAGIC